MSIRCRTWNLSTILRNSQPIALAAKLTRAGVGCFDAKTPTLDFMMALALCDVLTMDKFDRVPQLAMYTG
jgi:hypothetical protein